jgi:hypothetical protein
MFEYLPGKQTILIIRGFNQSFYHIPVQYLHFGHYRFLPHAFQLIIHLLFSPALQPNAGSGLLVTRGFLITHNDAPQSVELLWTSDQLVAETST